MSTTTTRTLTLAHSPDADDLVMWWPLSGITGPDGVAVDGELGKPRVDTQGFSFELVARDVEELNQAAIDGSSPYDVTAISCGAYPKLKDVYAITRSGASFGENYGPKVVVKNGSAIASLEDLSGRVVAIPGVNTSAYLTLRLMVPGVEARPMLFSEIPGAVARGDVDAGLLIHEAQLTFGDLGLRAVVDLGQRWHETHGGDPLPLGLNVVARSLDERFGEGSVEQVSGILGDSIRCAVEHRDASKVYLRLNKGTRDEWDDDALVDRYLDMYVSPMTLDMGERGRVAIERFLALGADAGLVDPCGVVAIV